MKINSHPDYQSLISEVKYSAAIFTVDVESDGEQFPIDIVFEYRTIIGHGSNIVRIDFEVAFDAYWIEGKNIQFILWRQIDKTFPDEGASGRQKLMDTLMEIIDNFQNNIINLKE
jgi:hypothetical protein